MEGSVESKGPTIKPTKGATEFPSCATKGGTLLEEEEGEGQQFVSRNKR